MPGRRDAMVAAARIIVAVQELARSYAPGAVATVGSLTLRPNSRNTVPGKVECSVDLRHPRDKILARMGRELGDVCERCAAQEGVEMTLDEIWHNPPVQFDDSCVAAVRGAANELGYRHQDIVSGAGHDACQICRVVPTAMIFVPCAGGLSHNEEESAEPEDLEAGCNVLLRAMLVKAGEL
jgi:N-carbamoyl-L-amino-acid hydrolase